MPNPTVIYEDKDFLVINKPAGLLVHSVSSNIQHSPRSSSGEAGRTSNIPTLVDWLLIHYPEVATVGDPVKLPDGSYGASDPLRPGIVHRLDKDTSGVMIIPRNQETFLYFKSLFQKHEIQKTYLAVVYGVPKENTGIIDQPIGIKNGTTKRSIRSEKMAKSAITEYRVLKRFTTPKSANGASGQVGAERVYSLLEVRPKTGRTHQIRVHLSSIGYPIVGDVLYTKRERPLWAKRLMLHALALEFTSPRGEHLRIETKTPEEFETI